MSVFFNFFVNTGLTQSNNVATSSNYTAMFWFKFIDEVLDGQYRTPFVRADATYDKYIGIFSDDNTVPRTLYLTVVNGSGNLNSVPVQYIMGRWYHAAIVSLGNSHKLIIDGVASTPVTVDMTGVSLSTMFMGDDGFAVAGTQIAYFREWNTALTDAEVIAERLSTTPVKTTNLVTNTPLQSNLLDGTTNANNWISTGGDTIEYGSQPILQIYGPSVLAILGEGPDGNFGRNVIIFDKTDGTILGANSFIDNFLGSELGPTSIVYRPAPYDDFLVACGGGGGQGGVMFQLDRYFNVIFSTIMAVPHPDSSYLWSIQSVRTDFHGGVYVGYSADTGTSVRGDQFVRKINPVTFQPFVPDQFCRAFIATDGNKTPSYGDFSLDGSTLFFIFIGGPGFNQNYIYGLNFAGNTSSTFSTRGTWSGGINPNGDTYRRNFIRPRSDGSYAVIGFHQEIVPPRTTPEVTRNEVILLNSSGSAIATYVVGGTSLMGGLVLDGDDTLYYTNSRGKLGRVDLTTGAETVIIPFREDSEGSTLSLGDLVMPPDGDDTDPPDPPDPPATGSGGIYFINPTKSAKHDSYYGGIENKIPNPTIKTALIGE